MRAFQIDLARQKENLGKVFEIFDFASKCRYDTIVLYLEDRIKTESYPYGDDAESYTVDEAKSMVKYAGRLGIELIPVVSNFGHAERFLAHDELKHLWELRDGIPDRFGGYPGEKLRCDACPSLDETYAFFDKYISEISAIFPSQYFHIGLDEMFNIGLCEKCRAREGGISKIFADHVNHSYKLLKSLGKHMMMWEDMFEMCPEALDMVPNDIVVCVWNYRYISDGMQGHLNCSKREDLIGKFLARGFEVLCSCHYNFSNIDSYLNFASRHNTLGFLVTIWELSREQFDSIYPFLAYFSRRYDGENDQLTAMYGAVRDVFPMADNSFCNALLSVMSFQLNGGNWNYPTPFTRNSLPDRLDSIQLMQRSLALDALEKSVFEEYKNHPTYIALRDNCRVHVINYTLLFIHQELTEHRAGIKKCDIRGIEAKLVKLREFAANTFEAQKSLWNTCRNGLPSPDMDKKFSHLINAIDSVCDIAKFAVFGSDTVLTVSFFTNDTWNIPMFGIQAIYDDGSTYDVFDGSVKPVALELKSAPYTVNFILPDKRIPTLVKLTGKGYGGAGFSYVEAVSEGKHYTPYAVSEVSGSVKSSENVLVYDNTWCYMGNEDVPDCCRNHENAMKDNSITVKLK
ncbi:MAG: hypothetical protein E7588_08470 [Ruminococcaceae bacterium]|nr:hypothetical protein [Oscillospiraceae bacterium]